MVEHADTVYVFTNSCFHDRARLKESEEKMSKKIKKYTVKLDKESIPESREEARPVSVAEDNVREDKAPAAYNGTESEKKSEKRSADEAKSRKKRIIITVAACLLAFVVLYYGITAISSVIKQKKQDDEASKAVKGIKFHTPNYTEDITQDSVYMGLDRNFYFEDSSNGFRTSYDPESLEEVSDVYRDTVRTITRYLEAAIAGDAEELNECLSDWYFDNGGKQRERIAPQKLYDILITTDTQAKVSDLPASSESYCYWVEYKIRMNNGTFRDDMGSDGVRKELFAVSVRDGEAVIDAVIPFRSGS